MMLKNFIKYMKRFIADV